MTSVNLFDACSDAFLKKCENLEKDISKKGNLETKTALLPILQKLKETASALKEEKATVHDINHHLTVLEEKIKESPVDIQNIEQKIEELKADWQKLILDQTGTSQDTLKLIDHYAELEKQFQNTPFLSTQIHLAEQLKEVVEKMQVAGFSDTAKYQYMYESLTSETWKLHREALQYLKDFETNPDPAKWSFLEEKWMSAGERVLGVDDLLELCVEQKKQHLIPSIILTWVEGSHQKFVVVDKPVLNFLLDKTYFPQSFSGGRVYQNAALLYNVLNSLQTASYVQNAELQPIINQLADRLLPALPNLIKWSSTVNPQEIASQIAHIQEGKPVLIPVDMKTHAMCILAEITKEGFVQMHFFNTGFGLRNNHPDLPGTNRFQTFLTIENVPLQHLTDPNIWQTFFEICQNKKLPNEERVGQIYEFYRNKLGMDLPITPPSQDQEDYEQIQMRGTCSAQNLMACLRHQIMAQAPGTKTEKLAAYKMIKSQLLDLLAGGTVNELDQKIKEAAEKKLDKHGTVMHLSNIASDKSTFQPAFESLLNTLSQLGEKEFVEGIRKASPKSLFDRYHMLRLCSQRIAHHWLENPESINLDNLDDLSLAMSIFESRWFTENQIEKEFQSLYEKQKYQKLGADLASLLTKTSFQGVAMRWILEVQCPETLDLNKPEDRARIDYLLSKMGSATRAKPFKEMLIQKLEEMGRKEMAEYVRQYIPQSTKEPQFY